jgi:transcriptional regulator with XRE-family HTH domain
VAEGSPTVRSRELGKRLRELRTARGLTVEEVAEKLLCSAAKVSRAETGARRQTLRDVRDLCALYNVSPEQTAELMELTKEARQQGWWAEYSDLKIPQLIGYEQEATAITCFGMYFVHALLQTEDYAAAIIKAVAPQISPEILRQRVEARMRRQQLLERPDRPRYRVLLDETVLRRPFGSGAVMQAQLDKMLRLIAEEKVTVQIIPYESGAYAAMDSNFDYLEFGGSAMRGLVFVEGLVHMYYFEKEAELARYAEALDYLRDTALSPRDSIRLITEIKRTHGGGS